MKITGATVFRIELAAMKEGARHAPLLLRLDTDDGIEGAGEIGLAYGMGGRGAAEILLDLARAFVIGRDPFDSNAIHDAMTRSTFWGTAGGAIFHAAISAIDEALWDIKGKALGKPVCDLLGGACRPDIRLYCNGWYRSAALPAHYAELAKGVVARGFDAMKFDPMKLDATGHAAHPNRVLDRDLETLAFERVAAVRQAVGPDVALLIELHGNMWPMHSLRFASRIRDLDPFFLEEPADPQDEHATARVARETGIPIAAGERLVTLQDFRRFFALDALHVAQPDMGIAGGFTGLLRIAALAAAHGVYIQPHNCGGPVSTAACVHLSFAIPNFIIQEVFPVWPDDRLDLVDAPYERAIVGGRIARPTRPGLGVTLDRAFLARGEAMAA
jgi:galactonate dehydratase